MKKKQVSFSPKKSHNYSGYHCQLMFEKRVKTAIEESIEMKGDDIIAKSTENYKSVQTECLKILDFFKVLNASLHGL